MTDMADKKVKNEEETEAVAADEAVATDEAPVTEEVVEAPVEEPVAETVEAAVAEPAAEEAVEPTEEPTSEAAAAAPEAEAPTAAAPAVSSPKVKKKRIPRALRPTKTRPKREKSETRKPITRLEKPEGDRGRRQERQGKVVSDAMDKTIVVKVDVMKAHPKYKKVVRHSVKFHAHDERSEAKVGDIVRIIETRPLSKTKRWRLAEVVEAAK
jgi:ribosomal protein uS17